jgi:uncharacterized OB-fold protein
MTQPAIELDIQASNAPYWEGLQQGQLKYQSCRCGHHWLPARLNCPHCLGTDWQWQVASGEGVIHSWVVFHVAYHPAFKERLPYNVAIVRLNEGPQLISNILAPNDQLRIGAPVRLSIDRSEQQALARFELLD